MEFQYGVAYVPNDADSNPAYYFDVNTFIDYPVNKQIKAIVSFDGETLTMYGFFDPPQIYSIDFNVTSSNFINLTPLQIVFEPAISFGLTWLFAPI